MAIKLLEYDRHTGTDEGANSTYVRRVQLSDCAPWFLPYLKGIVVNVGCGLNPIEGCTNYDECDWMLGAGKCPVEESSVDAIISSHVMEHVVDIIAAMREIHTALKPGGHFLAITPYATSNDAWEDPTHVRVFTEGSWAYFDKTLYERPNQLGHYRSKVDYIFKVENMWLLPYPGFENDPELPLKKHHYRNVIRELHVALKAVK